MFLTKNTDETPIRGTFDNIRSPFAAQAAAFQAAVCGEPHDFSCHRDLALMRLFDSAYQEARACL